MSYSVSNNIDSHIFTVSMDTKDKSQLLARFADQNDLMAFDNASSTILSISKGISEYSEIPLDAMYHFKRLNDKSYETLKIKIQSFCQILTRFNQFRLNKSYKIQKDFRKKYNKSLTIIFGKFTEESPLRGLLYLDENLKLIKHEEKIVERVSCLDGLKVNPRGTNENDSKFILRVKCNDKNQNANQSNPQRFMRRQKVKKGSSFKTRGLSSSQGYRCSFDSSEEALSCIKAFIERSNFEDLYFERTNFHSNPNFGTLAITPNGEIYHCNLKIKFPQPPESIVPEPFILSNDTGLLHILCEEIVPDLKSFDFKSGKVPLNFRRLFPIYSEYLDVLYGRIHQIINESFADPRCPFMILPCCRISPVCNHSNLTLKSSISGRKKHICGGCKMELCSGGCGRIYHGETNCNINFDEASSQYISETTKTCPGCSVNIFRSEGCNHMTCVHCRTEFCFVCGEEFQRDRNNRYMVSEHFRDNGVGNSTRRCFQFN